MNIFFPIFVLKYLFQPNYTFLYGKFGHFPLFYKNTVRGLKIQAIIVFLSSGPYDSLTSLCKRAARVVGCCANQGTLITMTHTLQLGQDVSGDLSRSLFIVYLWLVPLGFLSDQQLVRVAKNLVAWKKTRGFLAITKLFSLACLLLKN